MVALAHNGNLVNAQVVRAELEAHGSIFSSSTDSEVIVHLVARSKSDNLVEATAEALSRLSGAYSLVLMNERELLGIRDPHGFRPLSLGQLGDAWVLASESCAFDLIEATFVRDLEPGEFLHITPNGMKSYYPLPSALPAQCIFEYIYFARPDSVLFGQSVAGVRKALGRQLAEEAPADADLVIPVPDSGVPAALGFAEQSGLPFDHGLIRNHYVGRTFIEPKQNIRHFGVKIKLNPVREILEGKRVVVVDDSIVRGTTSRKIVSMVRSAGAREVHMRISAPPTVSPVLLRHRHADPEGADRLQPLRGRDLHLHPGGQPGVSQHGGAAEGRGEGHRLLPRLLHHAVPRAVPHAGRGAASSVWRLGAVTKSLVHMPFQNFSGQVIL